MAETVKQQKKTYPELRDALGEALIYQGELKGELDDLNVKKAEQKKFIRAARWFSEERYRRKAHYWTIMADIAEVRSLIKENQQLVKKLETAIVDCGKRQFKAEASKAAKSGNPTAGKPAESSNPATASKPNN